MGREERERREGVQGKEEEGERTGGGEGRRMVSVVRRGQT